MPKVAVYNMNAEQVGELELDDRLWNAPIRPDLMHEVVLMHLAGRRVGTHATKTRSEVRGGGRKPWRQKGTGRARQGSIRAPQWKGGGTVHGPQPRSYKYTLPKKVRRAALYSALSSKLGEGKLIVLDGLQFDQPKTKQMVALLNKFNVEKALIVDASKDANAYLSARNLPGVKYVVPEGMTVYDLLRLDHLVLTKDAVAKVQEVYA
ncbi:MAG: 50S ribosomal protein L4 [Thermoflavifilum sp.]|nr:50S ribosomal protein L4 [Thermoflavifilum sp.]MCL6513546.1 50S ribosomal protein L4 [Alicyclobacillus sp.]